MNTEIVPFTEWWEQVGGEAPTHYVYQMLNSDGEVIYVGATMELRRRMHAHYKQYAWVAEEVFLVELESEWDSRQQACHREQHLIATLSPKYNRTGTGTYQGHQDRKRAVSHHTSIHPDYESTPEAAARLGVSYRTIQRWVKSGRIEGMKAGKNYIVRRGATSKGRLCDDPLSATGGVV